MTRGKYGERATHRREELLARQVEDLKAKLSSEKAARRADQLAFAEERSQVSKRILDGTATILDHTIKTRVEAVSRGLTETDLQAHRTVMTRHLCHLFLARVIDWDRLRGDVEVLTFLAAHGDLGEWFRLIDVHVFGADRGRRRERAKEMPFASLLRMERTVDIALDDSAPAQEKYLQMRRELNDVLEEARNRYMDGDGPIPLPEGMHFDRIDGEVG